MNVTTEHEYLYGPAEAGRGEGPRCRECGGLNGAHGLVHTVAGGNVPCKAGQGEGRATLPTPDGVKMTRETLCVAQATVARTTDARRDEHIRRLQVLINACDVHRPLGPDCKHGDRHTPTCGCEVPAPPSDDLPRCGLLTPHQAHSWSWPTPGVNASTTVLCRGVGGVGLLQDPAPPSDDLRERAVLAGQEAGR